MKCFERVGAEGQTRALLLMLVLLLAGGCTTTGESGFSKAPLLGMLYDGAHQPCPGARISLDDRAVAVSDAFGRFLLSDVTRGRHRLAIRKPGYESRIELIDFQSASEVLYVRLQSSEQLAERAELALANEDYGTATELLGRARAIDPKGVLTGYLSAILSLRRRRYQESKEQLLILLTQGVDAPAVYLLLSDIYRLYLGRKDVALSTLRRGIDRTGDESLRRRLAELSFP